MNIDYTTRTANLEAARTAIATKKEAAIVDANALVRDAHVEATGALAAVEREAVAVTAAYEASLTQEVRTTLTKLFAGFPDAPRKTAIAIADAWRTFDARCETELGAPLSEHMLGLVIATAYDSGERYANEDATSYGHPNSLARPVAEAVADIRKGLPAPAIEQRLRDTEAHIAMHAHKHAPEAHRMKAFYVACTHGSLKGEFDRAADEHRRTEAAQRGEDADRESALGRLQMSYDNPDAVKLLEGHDKSWSTDNLLRAARKYLDKGNV